MTSFSQIIFRNFIGKQSSLLTFSQDPMADMSILQLSFYNKLLSWALSPSKCSRAESALIFEHNSHAEPSCRSKKQGRKKPGKKVTTNKVQRKKNPISNTQIFILTRSPFERVEYCLLCQNAEIHVFFKFSTLLHRFSVQIDLNSLFGL